MQHVDTKQFGSLRVSPHEIFTFPEGLVGMPQFQSFFVVDAGHNHLILWLQSLNFPDLAFPILEPRLFSPYYTFQPSKDDLEALKLSHLRSAAVFSIITIPRDAVSQMTANLKAPLVINLTNNQGRQLILQDPLLPLKHPIFHTLTRHLAQKTEETPSAPRPLSRSQLNLYNESPL